VGTLIALTFLLTLEDPHRFGKSRDVGGYLGTVRRINYLWLPRQCVRASETVAIAISNEITVVNSTPVRNSGAV
jgi:hypothetical protein